MQSSTRLLHRSLMGRVDQRSQTKYRVTIEAVGTGDTNDLTQQAKMNLAPVYHIKWIFTFL